MTSNVHIVTIGARTPLGLSAAPSAAAYRGGISSVSEHPFMVDRVGDPMPGSLDRTLDPAMMGADRLLALAETALREACAPLASSPRLRLPLFVGLPELRPGFSRQDAEAVRSRLARVAHLPIEISEVKVLTQGHAAGLAALAAAMDRLQAGAVDACLVGGVDSYFQPDTMEWLDENRQLVGTVSRSAFVPGEGAGFCMLMTPGGLNRFGLSAMARVRRVAIGSETKLIKTADLCVGAGLTAVVRDAIGGEPRQSEAIHSVFCDINGERYRGEEWGFVCLRLSQYFDDPTAYESPADCWGDMGAASGPLFAMLACEAAARGYAKGARTLLWASSEGGLRGAAVLDVVNEV